LFFYLFLNTKISTHKGGGAGEGEGLGLGGVLATKEKKRR